MVVPEGDETGVRTAARGSRLCAGETRGHSQDSGATEHGAAVQAVRSPQSRRRVRLEIAAWEGPSVAGENSLGIGVRVHHVRYLIFFG